MSDYCKYCLQPLELEISCLGPPLAPKDYYQAMYWLSCNACNVTYSVQKQSHHCLFHIKWEMTDWSAANHYALNFHLNFWDDNSTFSKSCLLCSYNAHKDSHDRLKISSILNNVTPSTLKDKIKILLTFS